MFGWNWFKKSEANSFVDKSLDALKSVAKAKAEESHKSWSVPLAVVVASIPAIWLGGCLATSRPAWFMRRSSVERVKETMKDAWDDTLKAMNSKRYRAAKRGFFSMKH